MVNGMTITRTPAPVREQAVRILQGAIANGHFAPGQRLVERELCELLGASRTTVREALRQLEAEGLVRVVPGKGVVAASISATDAIALYQVREVLEGLTGRLFAENASDQSIANLEAVLQELAEAVEQAPNDFKGVLMIKDRLYQVLFEGCGNPVLRALAASVHARVTLLRSMSLSHPGRLAQMLSEMRAMVDAIRRRDSLEAEKLCALHVRGAARAALEMLQQTEPANRSQLATSLSL